MRALLIAGLLVCAGSLSGCGLLPAEPIGFRTYTLENVGYEEGVSVVREAVRAYAVEHFGGTGITWDPAERNLSLDTVYAGRRRMKLYMHFEPRPPDLDVEMLALVETLDTSGGGEVGWVNPQMDVTLEEALFQACVNELLARRGAQP